MLSRKILILIEKSIIQKKNYRHKKQKNLINYITINYMTV